MITRLNVASIYVLDKDEALDFYVNKLGLEIGSDFTPGRLPLADGPRPRPQGRRDLARAARPAAARRGDRPSSSAS